MVVEHAKRPSIRADGHVEYDARLGFRRGVHAVPRDLCQRISRQDGETVMPLIPFDAGCKDVMKPERLRQFFWLIDEAAAPGADVDFLQGKEVGLHGPHL